MSLTIVSLCCVCSRSVNDCSHKCARTHTNICCSFLKVRRRQQTFFVSCHSTQTAAHVKKEVTLALSGFDDSNAIDEGIKLVEATRSDHEWADDTTLETFFEESGRQPKKGETPEIYAVFGLGNEEWEPIDVMDYEVNE